MIADLAYREVGCWRGQLDLYLPHGTGPHPVLVYFHGGGWKMGGKAAAAEHASSWNAMGLAVAAPSYRLVDSAPAPAAVDDAVAAVEWVRENATVLGLDAKRMVVAGHSAGGLLALCAGYREHSQVAAVVAWSAQCDLVRYYAERKNRGDPVAWLAEAHHPELIARALSPLQSVRPALPPTLLVHSEADPRAPYRDAVLLADALADAGVPGELITMRSTGHLTADHPPDEVSRGHAATHAFLTRHSVLSDERHN